MAQIEIMPLTDRLEDDEVKELVAALKEAGVRVGREGDEAITVSDAVDDDALSELLDHLEAHDAACDIYLPAEFDGRYEVADVQVGSAPMLIDVLDEIQGDLFADVDEDEEDDEDEEEEDDEEAEEDEEEDDEEEEEEDPHEVRLRLVWKLLRRGAKAAIDRRLPLHLYR